MELYESEDDENERLTKYLEDNVDEFEQIVFDSLNQLISIIEAVVADEGVTYQSLISEILGLIDRVKPFIRSREGFWSHTHFKSKDIHGPASHCSYFAFGRRDPSAEKTVDQVCGHIHSGVCRQCEEIMILPELINVLWEKVKACGIENSKVGKRKILDELDNWAINKTYFIDRYFYYVGHQCRLCHEEQSREEMNERERLVCYTCKEPKKLLRCARCCSIFYCSRECSKKDWKRHKNECVQKPK